jgi:hypothetical protein
MKSNVVRVPTSASCPSTEGLTNNCTIYAIMTPPSTQETRVAIAVDDVARIMMSSGPTSTGAMFMRITASRMSMDGPSPLPSRDPEIGPDSSMNSRNKGLNRSR